MRNAFLNSFKLAKETKSDLWFCNKKQEFFLLGHILPETCCEKIISFDIHPVKDILVQARMRHLENIFVVYRGVSDCNKLFSKDKPILKNRL